MLKTWGMLDHKRSSGYMAVLILSGEIIASLEKIKKLDQGLERLATN